MASFISRLLGRLRDGHAAQPEAEEAQEDKVAVEEHSIEASEEPVPDAATPLPASSAREEPDMDATELEVPEARPSEPEAAETEARAAARRARAVKPDAVLVEARELAREAIAEIAPAEDIGAYEGARAEGPRLVTHSFACTAPGYRGWSWIAVLARAPRSKKATVCETALLPGAGALVAPAWVPWENRIEPGDMRPQDVLPRLDRDPSLEPGYEQTGVGQEEYEDVSDADRLALYELGLGRERVLSPEGLRRAAERWQKSERGPEGEFAQQASKTCGSCGYLLPIAGSMRQQFGICASEWSPHDGKVVSLDAGCGAHSETDEIRPESVSHEPMVDDLGRGLEATQLS